MPERFEIYIVYKRRYINTLPFLFFLCCLCDGNNDPEMGFLTFEFLLSFAEPKLLSRPNGMFVYLCVYKCVYTYDMIRYDAVV